MLYAVSRAAEIPGPHRSSFKVCFGAHFKLCTNYHDCFQTRSENVLVSGHLQPALVCAAGPAEVGAGACSSHKSSSYGPLLAGGGGHFKQPALLQPWLSVCAV